MLGAASREFFERQPALMAELWTHYLHLPSPEGVQVRVQKVLIHCRSRLGGGVGSGVEETECDAFLRNFPLASEHQMR